MHTSGTHGDHICPVKQKISDNYSSQAIQLGLSQQMQIFTSVFTHPSSQTQHVVLEGLGEECLLVSLNRLDGYLILFALGQQGPVVSALVPSLRGQLLLKATQLLLRLL